MPDINPAVLPTGASKGHGGAAVPTTMGCRPGAVGCVRLLLSRSATGSWSELVQLWRLGRLEGEHETSQSAGCHWGRTQA